MWLSIALTVANEVVTAEEDQAPARTAGVVLMAEGVVLLFVERVLWVPWVLGVLVVLTQGVNSLRRWNLQYGQALLLGGNRVRQEVHENGTVIEDVDLAMRLEKGKTEKKEQAHITWIQSLCVPLILAQQLTDDKVFSDAFSRGVCDGIVAKFALQIL